MINRPDNIQIKIGENICSVFYPNSVPIKVTNYNPDKYTDITEFNYAYFDFSTKFNHLRDTICDKPQSKYLLELDKPELEPYFEIVRKVSNTKTKLLDNEVDNFIDAYQKIFSSLNELEDYSSYDYFIVPLMGGGIISKLLKIPSNKIVAVNAKRVPLNEPGSFGLGLSAENNEFGLISTQSEADAIFSKMQGKNICILEVCVASGITTCGFLIDFHLRNIQPKKLSIVSAVMSAQSINTVASDIENLQLNFDIKFVTGKVLNRLLDFYEEIVDSIAYDNGDKAVISPADAYKFKFLRKNK